MIARPLLQRRGAALSAQQRRLGVDVAAHKRREAGNVILLQSVGLGAGDTRRHLLGNRLVLEQNWIARMFTAARRRNRLVLALAGERAPQIDVDLMQIDMKGNLIVHQ